MEDNIISIGPGCTVFHKFGTPFICEPRLCDYFAQLTLTQVDLLSDEGSRKPAEILLPMTHDP